MDIFGIMGHIENIYREFDTIGETEQSMILPALCMAFDYCATKTEQTASELLEMLSPLIVSVNEELGAMKIA